MLYSKPNRRWTTEDKIGKQRRILEIRSLDSYSKSR